MLDERLADVLRREAALEQSEQHLQHALARVEEQGAATTQRSSSDESGATTNPEAEANDPRSSKLAEVDEARRTLDEHGADRSACKQAPAQPDPADGRPTSRRLNGLDERAAELAQREATLVEVAQRVQRSLAETAAQRSQLEQGRASVEEAERKVEERLAESPGAKRQLGQEAQLHSRRRSKRRAQPAVPTTQSSSSSVSATRACSPRSRSEKPHSPRKSSRRNRPRPRQSRPAGRPRPVRPCAHRAGQAGALITPRGGGGTRARRCRTRKPPRARPSPRQARPRLEARAQWLTTTPSRRQPGKKPTPSSKKPTNRRN